MPNKSDNSTAVATEALSVVPRSSRLIVRFENVGGGKKSWTAILPELSWRSLKKAVRDAHAIGSRYPEFVTDDEEKTGCIFCGFRPCGTFSWRLPT